MFRSILHIDMNAFYVSVELRRRPELRGKPVVVGGTGGRGVVSAASYEARRFGVHSALSSAVARRLCPDAIFIHPDMEHYLEVSRHLQEIFETFTPLVEQISVDEAFLDVTGAGSLIGDAQEVARQLREKVMSDTELPCTVGIAPNKFIAKMASEFAKPRARPDGIEPGFGIYEVRPGDELAFLHPLPVSSLWGVGPKTLARLDTLGIHTIGDVAVMDVDTLCGAIGDAHGRHLHELSHGRDERHVEPERHAKSIGHEETFSRDISDTDELKSHLVRLCDAVAKRTRDASVAAGTVMLKVKFASFESVTRSITPSIPLTTGPSMVAALEPLLATLDISQGVRLLGVHAQKLSEERAAALTLFDMAGDGEASLADIEEQWMPASRAVDSIVEKFGDGVIGPASSLDRHRPGTHRFGVPDAPGD
jgi:DNA polymerase-4